jgi:tRNA threonylcarbamoyladenosine biosynthesis protein TsaB
VILALDTTGEHGSIALVHGGRTLEELALHAPTGFAHVLYDALAGLLDRNGVKLADIDCFAAASGPGSFTGVRVGLAAIKGLAAALGKPAVAVSNLEAIASFGTAPLRAPVIDARRGEIYGAVYSAEGAPIQPEVVTKLDAWLTTVPSGAQFVSPLFPEGVPLEPRVPAPRELAAAIARIAERREWQDPAALDANYVRRSDAELFWKED